MKSVPYSFIILIAGNLFPDTHLHPVKEQGELSTVILYIGSYDRHNHSVVVFSLSSNKHPNHPTIFPYAIFFTRTAISQYSGQSMISQMPCMYDLHIATRRNNNGEMTAMPQKRLQIHWDAILRTESAQGNCRTGEEQILLKVVAIFRQFLICILA